MRYRAPKREEMSNWCKEKCGVYHRRYLNLNGEGKALDAKQYFLHCLVHHMTCLECHECYIWLGKDKTYELRALRKNNGSGNWMADSCWFKRYTKFISVNMILSDDPRKRNEWSLWH